MRLPKPQASSHPCWGPAKTMLSSSPGTEGSGIGGAWILPPCGGSGREFSSHSCKDRKRRHGQGAQPGPGCHTHQVAGVVKLYLPAGLGKGWRSPAVCKQRQYSFLACLLSGMCCPAETLTGWLVSASGRRAASLLEMGKLPRMEAVLAC